VLGAGSLKLPLFRNGATPGGTRIAGLQLVGV
jgi:hypothetical protein